MELKHSNFSFQLLHYVAVQADEHYREREIKAGDSLKRLNTRTPSTFNYYTRLLCTYINSSWQNFKHCPNVCTALVFPCLSH